jgi:Nuclease-related domain
MTETLSTKLITSSYHLINLIIEVKNMTGTLTFDTENDQFYQTVDGVTKGYQDPISQVQRHQSYLQKLLAENNFPPVPVDYLLVINNPNAILVFKGTPYEVRKRVCKYHSFFKREQLLEKKYIEEFLSSKELRKLSRLLLKKKHPTHQRHTKKIRNQEIRFINGSPLSRMLSSAPYPKKQKMVLPLLPNFFKECTYRSTTGLLFAFWYQHHKPSIPNFRTD